MERSSNQKARLFWGVVISIVSLDVITKLLAFNNLPERVPQPVLEDWLRLTLVFNRGAAFGLHLGHDAFTRVVFTALTILALAILWRLLRDARPEDISRVLAISLVTGGAVGNLIDRLRWSRGVVDFVDIGIGASRWPTFNVADAAVTMGAFTLAVVLWREDARMRREAHVAASQAAPIGEMPGGTLPGQGTGRETAL